MTPTMNWQADLMRAHARLFESVQGEPHLSFGYPQCGEGWRDTLERLCDRIESALRDRETFAFVRIKQKMAILRADWTGDVSDGTAAKILEAVNLATARSSCTCEICGAEGSRYIDRGWFATLCDKLAAGDRVPKKPGFENVRRLRRRVARRTCTTRATTARPTV
ncbi:hypothetical protein [Bradyrhizobium sp. McL0615]|uniref:hypothetical protein n=1 Tax=Bradyrhizobium sp. McL0615 TaxID=3415673 RepID=UPI003CE6DC41